MTRRQNGIVAGISLAVEELRCVCECVCVCVIFFLRECEVFLES
jgi:hypothetical protein